MLLAAVVSALLVVANQVIDTWTEGHLLAAWIVLWTVAFAALGLLAAPARRAVHAVARFLVACRHRPPPGSARPRTVVPGADRRPRHGRAEPRDEPRQPARRPRLRAERAMQALVLARRAWIAVLAAMPRAAAAPARCVGPAAGAGARRPAPPTPAAQQPASQLSDAQPLRGGLSRGCRRGATPRAAARPLLESIECAHLSPRHPAGRLRAAPG